MGDRHAPTDFRRSNLLLAGSARFIRNLCIIVPGRWSCKSGSDLDFRSRLGRVRNAQAGSGAISRSRGNSGTVSSKDIREEAVLCRLRLLSEAEVGGVMGLLPDAGPETDLPAGLGGRDGNADRAEYKEEEAAGVVSSEDVRAGGVGGTPLEDFRIGIAGKEAVLREVSPEFVDVRDEDDDCRDK